MKSAKLMDILKEGNFVVPLYLFQLRDSFSLPFEEFLFLVYLSNLGEKFVFDPALLSKRLNYSLDCVMEFISDLTDRGFLSVDVVKNEKGIMEEYVSLEFFYSKVSHLLVEEINQAKETPTVNIYEAIEKEFGRPLSPIEYEIIKAWIDQNTPEELIMEALKEATFNGVTNLRYIDKIIYEWGKKGFKTAKDVENSRAKYRKEKEKKELPEVFEYNWLEDEDE